MGTVKPALLLLLGAPAIAKPALEASLQEGLAIGSDRFTIVAVTHDNGVPIASPVPMVFVSGVATAMEPAGKGHWAATQLIGEAQAVTIQWNGQQKTLPVHRIGRGLAAIDAPSSIDSQVGKPVEFSVTGVELDALDVDSNEGKSTARCSDDGCTVQWTPADEPFPRAVPLLISNPQRPKDPPKVVTVRIAATPTIPVQTEPGARVNVSVGGRQTNDQIADEGGVARFQVEVKPGDERATVSLEDTLGNRQTSTIMIGGNTGPVVSLAYHGTIIAGAPWPRVWVAAAHANGTPWKGETPICTGLTARGLEPHSDGLWVGIVDAANGLDKRVTCRAGTGRSSSTVVPVDRVRATRLVLQVYPPVLTADIPIAEVQAYLVNGAGERLASDGIRLNSERGILLRDGTADGRWVRARYDGTKAAVDGGDIVRATWSRPTGSGGVWNLGVIGSAPGAGDEIVVDARVVDQGGRPLEGVPVILAAGSQKVSTESNGRGWATSVFAWPNRREVVQVSARVGVEEKVTFVLRGDRAIAGPGDPDLVTDTTIQIQPGRVHGVVLNPDRRTLSNDGEAAEVTIRLEDKLGNLISGPEVSVTASAGNVRPAQLRANGEYVAVVEPPAGMDPGSVRVTATTDDGRFSASTDLIVHHKTVNWTLGVRSGGLIGRNSRQPRGLAGLTYERRLPYDLLYGRLGFSTYGLAAVEQDPVTQANVEMRSRVFTASGGLFVRKGAIGVPVWAGAQVVMAPFHQTVRLDDIAASNGWGWLSPGAAMTVGAGMRAFNGEAFMEFDYLFIAAPGGTIGWEGPVGGLVGSVGFKLLY